MPPIMVTGGCGFIGCNLADRLAERGERVLVLDNLARAGVRENAQWLKSRHADLVTITSYNEWGEGTQIEPAGRGGRYESYAGAYGMFGRSAARAWRAPRSPHPVAPH